jgi:hypothetical protein
LSGDKVIIKSLPNITASLPIGQNLTLGFPKGAVGAWSALYNDTGLRLGMINNTFGEFTFKSSDGCSGGSKRWSLGARIEKVDVGKTRKDGSEGRGIHNERMAISP